MRDSAFYDELERRLELLDSPESEEALLPELPSRDVWAAVLVLAAVSAVLVWWGYPA